MLDKSELEELLVLAKLSGDRVVVVSKWQGNKFAHTHIIDYGRNTVYLCVHDTVNVRCDSGFSVPRYENFVLTGVCKHSPVDDDGELIQWEEMDDEIAFTGEILAVFTL